jgi:hypothetical protein
MAQHVRYADGEKNERAVVKFVRQDLLWRGRIAHLDVPRPDGRRVAGPTILDVIERRLTEAGEAYWSMRPGRDFLERDRTKRADGHPFRAGLVSGGKMIDIDGDFVRVEKISSVSIGAYAFRLAVGALGSVGDAHAMIGGKAAAAWAADLARSRALYEAIKAAPGGTLQESPAVAALRPAGSISDQIETDILREACLLLGVDPDLSIRRAPGRPRKAAAGDTESGDFIAVTVADGVVTARTLAPIGGIPASTDLSTLTVLKLVALLGTLLQGGAQLDADLLEAYLDAAAPEWREAAGEAGGDLSIAGTSASDDPWAILGVSREMSFDDITRAYRRAMQAMHPDKGACPPWFAQVAASAYRHIKESMARDPMTQPMNRSSE